MLSESEGFSNQNRIFSYFKEAGLRAKVARQGHCPVGAELGKSMASLLLISALPNPLFLQPFDLHGLLSGTNHAVKEA